MINSKQKGNQGERDWAAYLRELGFTDARRGQQFKGTPDSPDVVDGIPGTHCEVKRVEKLNLKRAILKAIDEAGEDQIPYVAHRQNRWSWMVTVMAVDLLEFAKRIRGAK